MRMVLRIVGVLLIVCGAIWLLQGIGLLPGSFMTGQVEWAVIGGIALVAGIIMLVVSRRLALSGGRR